MHKMSFEIQQPKPDKSGPSFLVLLSFMVVAVFGLVFFDAWLH
jgi:hypothetical protein